MISNITQNQVPSFESQLKREKNEIPVIIKYSGFLSFYFHQFIQIDCKKLICRNA